MSSVSAFKTDVDDASHTTDKAFSTNKSTLKPSKGIAALTHTLQFYWFVGHLFLLIGTINYLLSYIGVFSHRFVWYRTAYIAALVSYGISLFEKYWDRKRSDSNHHSPALRDENLQYFAIALLWLLTSPVLGSLVPFAVFALLHTLGYVRQHLLPALGYSEDASISVKLADFSRRHNAALVYIAAIAELFLLVRLGLNLLLFRGFLKFGIYAVFIRVRYETSRFTRQAVVTWEHKIDGLICHAPSIARKSWINVKTILGGLPVLTGPSSISGLEKQAKSKTSSIISDVGKSTGVDTAPVSERSNNTTGTHKEISEKLDDKIITSSDKAKNSVSENSFTKNSTNDTSAINDNLSTNDKLSTQNKPLNNTFEKSSTKEKPLAPVSDKPLSEGSNPLTLGSDKASLNAPALDSPSLGTPFDKSISETFSKPLENTTGQTS